MTLFEDLTPPQQISAALGELDALTDKIDTMIAARQSRRVDADSHDGHLLLTLGYNGRLLSLYIADDLAASMTNRELETALNELLEAASCEMTNGTEPSDVPELDYSRDLCPKNCDCGECYHNPEGTCHCFTDGAQ